MLKSLLEKMDNKRKKCKLFSTFSYMVDRNPYRSVTCRRVDNLPPCTQWLLVANETKLAKISAVFQTRTGKATKTLNLGFKYKYQTINFPK